MLGGQLDAVRAGRGSIAVVTGLAGMGKSALLAEAGAMARNRGIRVFQGAGDAAGQVVPLSPLLEALVSTDDPPVDPALLRDLASLPTSGSGCCASCRKGWNEPRCAPRC